MKTIPTLTFLCALMLAMCRMSFAQSAAFTYQGRVTDNGTNFTGAGQFKFALVTSTNTSRTATATANAPSNGYITGYTIVDGGTGYLSAPIVTVSGGGGSGAGGTAVINGGVVTGITVTSTGDGQYTSAPTVTIAPPPANIAYTTYWSNDGTSVAGSEPTAAVKVNINNGLFTVTLGDTTLANMAAINASLFAQPNLQLRIWFDDGINGFAALDPAQYLTPAPYATMANTASNLLGTLPATQLAGTIANGNLPANPTFTGTVTASSLSGNGVGLTSLNANNLTSGTVPGGRLSGTYSSALTLNSTGNSFVGNGSGLISLNASELTSGVVPTSVLPGFQLGSHYETVGGGLSNLVTGSGGTVGGGNNNVVSNLNGTVSGGLNNIAGANDATVSGGQNNLATGDHSTVGGGWDNTASGREAVVAGGGTQPYYAGNYGNVASGELSSVVGGYNNIASGPGAFIGGGGDDGSLNFGNQASGGASVVVGGVQNSASGLRSVVGGGGLNEARGSYATVPGGANNLAAGQYSFAAGRQAVAVYQGTFVWADSQNANFTSTANDQFLVRAQGGVGINNNNPSGALSVNTGAGTITMRNESGLTPGIDITGGYQGTLRLRSKLEIWPSDDTTYAGRLDVRNTNGNATITLDGQSGDITCTTLNQTSDRNAKENFVPVDDNVVLDKIAALPITKWNYKTDAAEQKHIGPMAQDFHAAFGLNGNDDKHISVVDEGGVALAAIQGLNQKVETGDERSEARIQKLEAENTKLKRQLNQLALTVERLSQEINGGAR